MSDLRPYLAEILRAASEAREPSNRLIYIEAVSAAALAGEPLPTKGSPRQDSVRRQAKQLIRRLNPDGRQTVAGWIAQGVVPPAEDRTEPTYDPAES